MILNREKNIEMKINTHATGANSTQTMIKYGLLWDPLTLRNFCTRNTMKQMTNTARYMADFTFITDRSSVNMHQMPLRCRYCRRRERIEKIQFQCHSAERVVIQLRSSNSFLCKWTVASVHCSFCAFTWHTKNENENTHPISVHINRRRNGMKKEDAFASIRSTAVWKKW